MIIRADFHLHSCLSPCGDLEMSPSKIASVLKEKSVTLAALTDHNSALNVESFGKACKKLGILPLYGIEAQTQEEAHILCLFSKPQEAIALGDYLYEKMPNFLNDPEKTGDQVYVDEDENIIGEVEKYLITSADITIDDLCKKVIDLGGILIPAHVDRAAFSMTSQLGFIPEGPWSALELVRLPKSPTLDTHGLPLTTSSDAHYTEHIARRAFELDLQDDKLTDEDGSVKLDVLKKALERRPRE